MAIRVTLIDILDSRERQVIIVIMGDHDSVDGRNILNVTWRLGITLWTQP